MITFPCHCGYKFEVPQDLAGAQLQCPQCGLLNDVPTADELRNLEEDGSIRVGEALPLTDPDRFAELYRAYAKVKQDADGADIDMRQSMDLIEGIGAEEIPLADGTVRPAAPKYDPETGELIKPLEIVTHETESVNAEDIPLAKATLDYARVGGPTDIAQMRPALELLTPINLIAMFFAYIAQISWTWIAAVPFLGMFSPIAMFPLLAHYANVVEDIGPDERNELPRFLRDFSFSTDIWWPFCNMFLALMCCFTIPVMLAGMGWIDFQVRVILELGSLVIGYILFPAVVLTTTTSGAIHNLRPDRVLQVMATIGGRYALLVLLFMLTTAFYAVGMFLLSFHLWSMFFGAALNHPLFSGPVAYSVMFVAVYLMHYFCWQLGLTYRKYNDKFHWVFQRHIPTRGTRFPQNAPQRRTRKVKPAGWKDRYQSAADKRDGG